MFYVIKRDGKEYFSSRGGYTKYLDKARLYRSERWAELSLKHRLFKGHEFEIIGVEFTGPLREILK